MVALLLYRRWRVHHSVAGGFVILSHVMYILGQAFGQTYSVDPDARGYMRTLLLALNNQL